EPSLTLAQDEILLEDFIGEPEEGTGVLHRVEGAAPESTVEYTVETPANIQTSNSSGGADEDGVLEFWIHAFENNNPSVYLGEYVTTVTFEDAAGEPQELTAEFTVVDGTGNQNDQEGNGEDDEDITPVVD